MRIFPDIEFKFEYLDGQITKNQFLTKSTTEGLRVTVLSTIKLSQYLLWYVMDIVHTQRLCISFLEPLLVYTGTFL
jgi:hypothetical protein